jgi:hypothetical protein
MALRRVCEGPFYIQSTEGVESNPGIIFDYDCFTLGAAYSDWRNVTSGPEGAARAAFVETYGPVSETERGLDGPLSALYGLLMAYRHENVPGWARSLLEGSENGDLEHSVRNAMD